jgi:hypothetical protein
VTDRGGGEGKSGFVVCKVDGGAARPDPASECGAGVRPFVPRRDLELELGFLLAGPPFTMSAIMSPIMAGVPSSPVARMIADGTSQESSGYN